MSDSSPGPLENTQPTVSSGQYLISSLSSRSLILLTAPLLFKVPMVTENILGQQMSNKTQCIYNQAKIDAMYCISERRIRNNPEELLGRCFQRAGEIWRINLFDVAVRAIARSHKIISAIEMAFLSCLSVQSKHWLKSRGQVCGTMISEQSARGKRNW